jgi:ornithine carbamoyltransferase
MAYTWLQAAELLGFTLHVSTPAGYRLEPARIAGTAAGALKEFSDPLDACKGAHLVTTDVWTSMGYEAENEQRRTAFADWCVDQEMMAAAAPDALFMHCLPAHRGEEVEASVIDGAKSVIWREAFHRRTTIQALLYHLTRGELKGN